MKLQNKIEDDVCLVLLPYNEGSMNTLNLNDCIDFQERELRFDIELFEAIARKVFLQQEKQGKTIGQVPTYHYADIEIFCMEKQPYDVVFVTMRGEIIRNNKIRKSDWNVLKELVKAKGGIVCFSTLRTVISGTPYDDFESDHSEVHKAISRLKKIEGLKIKSKKGIGYYLEK